MTKPLILLTNDDGIFAPGIRHLFKALAPFADIAIVAPAQERSGMGGATTFHHPIRVDPVRWEGAVGAWKVDGMPVDCVKVGLSGILPRVPDLIASGINAGSNAGRTIFTSGTVGATVESAIKGFPTVAFSVFDGEEHLADAEPFIWPIVSYLLEFPLRAGTLLNVNFPHETPFKGVRFARQGLGYWKDQTGPIVNGRGEVLYDLSSEWADFEEHEENDTSLMFKGYIAASPIHVNELTDYHHIQNHKEHFEERVHKALAARDPRWETAASGDHQNATTLPAGE